jgi:periplasmic protein TonB
VSENRFLQSFFAVSASAVLVSGTLLLLSSTAPWNPPQLADGAPSTRDATRLSPEATASIDIEVPQAPLASDQAQTAESTEPDMAAADAEPEMPAQAEAEEPSVPALPEATSPEVEAVAALGTPLSPESADVSLDGSGAGAPVAVQAEATSEVGVASDAPAEIAVSVPLAEVADLRRDTATDQIAGMLAALPPRPITSDKSEAASTEVATMLAAEPPAPPPPPASDATEAATEKVAAVLAASQPAPEPAPVPVDAPSAAPKVAEVVVAPPPLPRRKPAAPQPEPKAVVRPAEPQAAPAKELAKQNVAPQKQAVAPQETEQPRSGSGPWKAMALAPADKPTLKVPTARPNNAAYGSQVWAALARHKPRAGVRGSATVVFSIGENGGLRGVKVGRSSGNERIDQLALQTVRSAAPYPPPPSGVATYTIRIDFQ